MNNIEIYTQRMNYTLSDKLFFTEHVNLNNIELFIDFGCADGILIEALLEDYPDLIYIGYDNCVEMSTKFSERFKGYPHVHFVRVFSELLQAVKTARKNHLRVAINFSSVLHEIYTYEQSPQIWQELVAAEPNYIFIRDMGYATDDKLPTTMSMINQLREHPLFADYIAHRNSNSQDTLVEFLLKYDYVENWDRERDEHYFYSKDYFTVPEKYYETYFHRFNLEYQVNKIKKDFDIDISRINTHYKAIYILRGSDY